MQPKHVGGVSTLNPLTWRIWRAPNNAGRWQIGFDSAFKGLMSILMYILKLFLRHSIVHLLVNK